jgi:hypothetical protein
LPGWDGASDKVKVKVLVCWNNADEVHGDDEGLAGDKRLGRRLDR